jgi:putative copper export protein
VTTNTRASHRVEDPLRLMLEVVIFGSAVAALAASGHATLAIVAAVAVAIHLALTFPLDQR